jgi:hypothetical protein
MAVTSRATLVGSEPDFARGGTTRGVWKGNTVTCCHGGRKIVLKTDDELSDFVADGVCCCDLIRVGDEFFVGFALGDPKQRMRDFKQIWGMGNPRPGFVQKPAADASTSA